MSEIICRYSVVALPETFGIEIPEDSAKHPRMLGTLRVTEGPEAGKELFWSGSLKTEVKAGSKTSAAEITMTTLRAMGWNCNDITALAGLGSVQADATGKWNVYTAANGEEKRNIQYSIWPKRVVPTLREEDQKKFRANFKALAVGLKNKVVDVTDANAAPTVLPPKAEFNQQRIDNAPAGDVGGADSLF